MELYHWVQIGLLLINIGLYVFYLASSRNRVDKAKNKELWYFKHFVISLLIVVEFFFFASITAWIFEDTSFLLNEVGKFKSEYFYAVSENVRSIITFIIYIKSIKFKKGK